MANASIPTTFASMRALNAPTRRSPWADDQQSSLAHGSGRLPNRGQDADWRPLHLRARPARAPVAEPSGPPSQGQRPAGSGVA